MRVQGCLWVVAFSHKKAGFDSASLPEITFPARSILRNAAPEARQTLARRGSDRYLTGHPIIRCACSLANLTPLGRQCPKASHNSGQPVKKERQRAAHSIFRLQ
jgi:hypothetical protein